MRNTIFRMVGSADVLRGRIRTAARWAARLRYTRAWPLLRPLYHIARRIVDVDAILGVSTRTLVRSSLGRPDRDLWQAPHAYEIDAKLWGGFSKDAIKDLEALRKSYFAPPKEQQFAAWYLARWHAFHGDYQQAFNYLGFTRTSIELAQTTAEQVLLESECLTRLGHVEYAREVLDRGLVSHPRNAHLYLGIANTYAPARGQPSNPEDDAMRLKWINEIYLGAGFAPVEKLNPNDPLTIWNLQAPTAGPFKDRKQPLITVIMPAYNAQGSIGNALRSLLDQTWSNLEILVVDDCSTDSTVEIVSSVAARDSRVRVIRHETNQGAYAARNTALAQAKGKFLTTHDSDDWSHPQKLEALASSLIANSRLVGSFSYWARATPELEFKRPWHRTNGLVLVSFSSFMFTRALLESLGRWDDARVSADAEFVWRARKIFGDRTEGRTPKGVPMAFSLFDPASLTQSGPTHLKTALFGLRREYAESAEWWYENTTNKEQLRLPLDSSKRPFPAPGIMHSKRRMKEQYDFVFILDFTLDGGAFVSTYNYILAAIGMGQTVGVFHWRRYELVPVARLINPKLRRLSFDGKVDILVPGQNVSAKNVIVGYPAILEHRIDETPKLELGRLLVIVNQMATRFYNGGDVQYDPLIARKHLLEMFGSEGKWIPISGLVRRLMAADSRYPEPHGEDWIPLIDTGVWCQRPLTWRGGERPRPVVGRHARDHYSKWPAIGGALRDAYLVDKPCDVKILGGATTAIRVVGRLPANWEVLDFNAIEPREFLAGLDFFIHFPHEDYIEEFGRSVIEAMGMGLPVILPPVFKDTFGAAALYAEPRQVWSLVQQLWSNEQQYLERAAAGRTFVLNSCGHEQFTNRMKVVSKGA